MAHSRLAVRGGVAVWMVMAALPSAAQVLREHGATRTSVPAGLESPIQGARPGHLDRAVGIDGVSRGAAGWPIGANPMEAGLEPLSWLGAVSLRHMDLSLAEVDLSLPADVPWTIGRGRLRS